jgi:hypothetical protein
MQKQHAQSGSVLEQLDYQIGATNSPIKKGYSRYKPIARGTAFHPEQQSILMHIDSYALKIR